MNLISKRIRGMQDILPYEGDKWLKVIDVLLDESRLYGFKFVRTPVLEHTNLFERSAGNGSDIVNKEMYSFKDKGNRDVSLRPEGTAGAVRLVLENGLHNNALPLKIMYYSSCYRYEKPQAGRYREFFQFGLEVFGSSSEMSDFEVICLGHSILRRLEVKDVILNINTIGCAECRRKYLEVLKKYLEENKESLCPICLERLDKNPLRILDCKNSECSKIVSNAPILLDYVCEDCLSRFNNIKDNLDYVGIKYNVNSGIVRGLDYYTGTVFEFLTKLDDTYVAVCGGGRYDNLAQTLGGVDLPAVGLGFGVERLLAIMEKQGTLIPDSEGPFLYIAAVGKNSNQLAVKLCEDLRMQGVHVQYDISDKTLKSQMKYASKINSTYIMVLGDNELESKKAIVRGMQSKEEFEVSLSSNFSTEFLNNVEKIILKGIS